MKNVNMYRLDHMELSSWLSAKYVLAETGVADVLFIRWHLPAALYVHGILSTELTAKMSTRMFDLPNHFTHFGCLSAMAHQEYRACPDR